MVKCLEHEELYEKALNACPKSLKEDRLRLLFKLKMYKQILEETKAYLKSPSLLIDERLAVLQAKAEATRKLHQTDTAINKLDKTLKLSFEHVTKKHPVTLSVLLNLAHSLITCFRMLEAKNSIAKARDLMT